jgi:glycerol uptake facilitator-like aquaporin
VNGSSSRLSIGEDWAREQVALRPLAAEAIGTFALVFAGAGAIMVDAETHALGHVGVAITFGLVIWR